MNVEESGGPSKAEQIIQQLNATNAKKVAFLMVIGFIAYHGLIHLRFGTDSCKWLLSKGRFKGDKEWQPYGCMMHKYSQTDSRRCFRYLAFWGSKNHFYFIGDIRIKILYQTFINHLHPSNDDNGSVLLSESGGNSNFFDYKLKLRAIYSEVNEFSYKVVEEFTKYEKDNEPLSTFIVSFTHSKFLQGNLTDDILNAYSVNLTKLLPTFERISAQKSRVIWKLQDKVNEEKLKDDWKNVLNDDIDEYNQAAVDVFKYSSVEMWESSYHIANGLLNEAIDGYKLNPLGLRHDIQLLLNMYCNDYMNYKDGTCCSNSEPYTVLQIITYSIFGVIIILGSGMIFRRWLLYIKGYAYMPLNQGVPKPSVISNGLSTPILALTHLGIILSYFYICDRTNYFMKENKYYSEFSFWIPFGYVFALGLFFTEESRFTKVLNRDQTDELKGWMILVILIYYMTGASRILYIHMHVKVLISAFLFLAGYSHFTFIWQTGNAGIIRFLQVIFRINFMSVMLCFCMNRSYQFYYFVPLISFWTCMVYFLLALPPQITSQSVDNNVYHYLYIVIKFVGILSLITVLYMSEVFFEHIFMTRPWKALFVTVDDDVHEWWYQWKLDRYTVSYGMIFAAVFHIAQKHGMFDDNNHGNLFSRRMSLIATLAAVIGISSYTSFTFLCKNNQNCEEIHSYISFIPIISYIILRNISGILRTRYSTFFSWFGNISLELFICQYHIWLAADRNGVLVLLPGFPTLNMIITSFIFVCASHEVHRLTQVLLPYAVPNDWKLALRNFVIFFIILILIGNYKSMF